MQKPCAFDTPRHLGTSSLAKGNSYKFDKRVLAHWDDQSGTNDELWSINELSNSGTGVYDLLVLTFDAPTDVKISSEE